jgi:hypothetical protein
MPASSIQDNVRSVIETAISSVAANVYDFVPEAPIPPFAAIVPSSPYMEVELIGRNSVRVKLNYIISAGVAYFSNPASLDNLEKLVISILSALPTGYELSIVETPSVTQVGTSTFLVSDIRLSVRYEQTS